MKLFLIIVAVVCALIVAVLVIGALLPKSHVASRQIVLHRFARRGLPNRAEF